MMTLIALIAASCSNARRLEKARALSEAGETFKAQEIYQKAYGKAKNKAEKAKIAYELGECNRQLNNSKKAEKWYKRAVRSKYPNPLSVLRYAEAMKMNDKYEDAVEVFNQYAELVPDDPRGELGAKSCSTALEWVENPTRYIVEVAEGFNSKQSDYAPAYTNSDYNTVLFTSTREGVGGGNFSDASGQNFADIFIIKRDRKGKWSEPVPVKGEINSEFDDGIPVFSSDFKTLMFTRARMSKNESLGAKVYTAKSGNDTWTGVEPLVIVPDSSVTVAHASLSPDGLSLFFVSDMDGGLGGKDIWKVSRTSTTEAWGSPENLGASINTVGDELFPYIRTDSVFYFSSNGHLGMGGQDIFKASKDENNKWQVENMKSPVNSEGDDFGICFQGEKEKGLFTSSRYVKGKKLGKDDIYTFYLPVIKFDMTGLVRDADSYKPIQGAKVTLEGSDGTTLEATTGKDGKFKFKLGIDVDYVLVSTKEKYLNGKSKESTKGFTESKTLQVKMSMRSIADKEKTFEVADILYDVAKWDLRPESMVSLDALVELLNDNKNITIELGSHTDFRGSDDKNQELSQKRAQSVVDYLIQKGINNKRLTAKGYGESVPMRISKKQAAKHDFLKEGDVLSEEFINNLASKKQKEIAHQINRRTEFKVLSTKFEIDAIDFGGE